MFSFFSDPMFRFYAPFYFLLLIPAFIAFLYQLRKQPPSLKVSSIEHFTGKSGSSAPKLGWLRLPLFIEIIGLALLIIALGALMIWASAPEATAVANIVYWLGLLMLAIATFFILLPGQARQLATTTWGSFSTGVLRGLGLVALIFGLLVAAYGLSL